MKSYVARPGEIKQNWFVVDAAGKTLGRMAARLATVLRGKHKPQFTPHLDCGDYVVVINAEKVRLTGKKLSDKVYTTHSGYPGGLKQVEARRLIQEKPERVIETAVRGMLPKNHLGRKMARKLHVYKGSEHPHSAQQPRPLDLDRLRAADAE